MLSEKNEESKNILVVIPVFNDWESLAVLLKNLDHLLDEYDVEIDILVLNDSSLEEMPPQMFRLGLRVIEKINVLHLRRNLGHQRAIAIGLAYAATQVSCKAVLVMDSDGEDRPEDIFRLIEICDLAGQ